MKDYIFMVKVQCRKCSWILRSALITIGVYWLYTSWYKYSSLSTWINWSDKRMDIQPYPGWGGLYLLDLRDFTGLGFGMVAVWTLLLFLWQLREGIVNTGRGTHLLQRIPRIRNWYGAAHLSVLLIPGGVLSISLMIQHMMILLYYFIGTNKGTPIALLGSFIREHSIEEMLIPISYNYSFSTMVYMIFLLASVCTVSLMRYQRFCSRRRVILLLSQCRRKADNLPLGKI